MTEAMPFLQKYDITFLRPLPICRGIFFCFFAMKIGPVLTDFIQQAKVAAYLLQCLTFFWYPNVRKYSPSSLYQDALTIPARPSSQRIGTVLKLMCNFKTFDKV